VCVTEKECLCVAERKNVFEIYRYVCVFLIERKMFEWVCAFVCLFLCVYVPIRVGVIYIHAQRCSKRTCELMTMRLWSEP
jgi:hypothetical protein